MLRTTTKTTKITTTKLTTVNPAFERAFQPPIETIHNYDYDSSNQEKVILLLYGLYEKYARNNFHQDYLDREMFGADRFESCSSPDFYCDGGCKGGFELYQTHIAETVQIGLRSVQFYILNPWVSLKDFDVMAVLTVLMGRMRSIAKN